MTTPEIILSISTALLAGAYTLSEIRCSKQVKAYREREQKRFASAHEDWVETREGGRLSELRVLQRFIERRTRMSKERYEASILKRK